MLPRRKLEWMLLRNFPRREDRELDWSIFEGGPLDFLCEFMSRLEALAKRTLPRLERIPRDLGMPAWEEVPACGAGRAGYVGHGGVEVLEKAGWTNYAGPTVVGGRALPRGAVPRVIIA